MNEIEKLQELQPEMVETLKKVIGYNTEKSQALPDAPFGDGNRNCLDYVLQTAKGMGLSTYNCDGYCGQVDFVSSGKQVVGILGHLDVVPAKKSDGWVCDPYAPEIIDGKLIGRGAMDDKGPMIACLYAVKALKDSGFAPKKTVRLIFGCDEECNMECVKYYFTKVKKPDIAFSPDGDFPVINREKGIYHFVLNFGKLDDNILSITAGERANVVPNLCVSVVDNSIEVGKNFIATADGKELTTQGKSAHGSLPQDGINATWKMFSRLHTLFPNDTTLAFIVDKMCDYTGHKLGICLKDKESGDLTFNIGVVRYTKGENLYLTLDIRFPITYTGRQITNLLKQKLPRSVRFVESHIKEPLFVPENSELVQKLLSVYNSETKENAKAIAIGGGTYSRALPNCVAFGPLFPGEEQTIHMPNEYISLEQLYTMARMYMLAIKELSQ